MILIQSNPNYEERLKQVDGLIAAPDKPGKDAWIYEVQKTKDKLKTHNQNLIMTQWRGKYEEGNIEQFITELRAYDKSVSPFLIQNLTHWNELAYSIIEHADYIAVGSANVDKSCSKPMNIQSSDIFAFCYSFRVENYIMNYGSIIKKIGIPVSHKFAQTRYEYRRKSNHEINKSASDGEVVCVDELGMQFDMYNNSDWKFYAITNSKYISLGQIQQVIDIFKDLPENVVNEMFAINSASTIFQKYPNTPQAQAFMMGFKAEFFYVFGVKNSSDNLSESKQSAIKSFRYGRTSYEGQNKNTKLDLITNTNNEGEEDQLLEEFGVDADGNSGTTTQTTSQRYNQYYNSCWYHLSNKDKNGNIQINEVDSQSENTADFSVTTEDEEPRISELPSRPSEVIKETLKNKPSQQLQSEKVKKPKLESKHESIQQNTKPELHQTKSKTEKSKSESKPESKQRKKQ